MMSIPYQLRPASKEDIEFLMHLEKEAFKQFPKVMKRFDEHHQKEHYKHHFQPKYVCIIELAHQPIGAVSILTRRKDISIVYLYVLPEFQDKNIDKSLIKRVLTRAKEEVKTVMTCVFKGDTQAKNMCDSLGFEVFAEDELRWRVKWIP
jgi:ribosomal protein S18 acetylase RimI-like enzyme